MPDEDASSAGTGGCEGECARLGEAHRVEGDVDAVAEPRSELLGSGHGVGGAERARTLESSVVRVDADDRRRAGEPRALDDELADAAGADHERRLARFERRGVADRAHAGERGAAEQGGLVERHVVAEGQRGVRLHDDVLGQAAGGRHPVHGLAVRATAASCRRAACRTRSPPGGAHTPCAARCGRRCTPRRTAPTRSRRGRRPRGRRRPRRPPRRCRRPRDRAPSAAAAPTPRARRAGRSRRPRPPPSARAPPRHAAPRAPARPSPAASPARGTAPPASSPRRPGEPSPGAPRHDPSAAAISEQVATEATFCIA